MTSVITGEFGMDVTWKAYEFGHWYKVPDEIDDVVRFKKQKAGSPAADHVGYALLKSDSKDSCHHAHIVNLNIYWQIPGGQSWGCFISLLSRAIEKIPKRTRELSNKTSE